LNLSDPARGKKRHESSEARSREEKARGNARDLVKGKTCAD